MHTRTALALHILIIVGSALLTNALIFALNWQDSSSVGPPGWVIGVVWLVLFTLISYARWSVRTSNKRHLLTALVMLCLAYPFYTGGLDSAAVGLAGIVVTLLYTGYVMHNITPISSNAALAIVPLVMWLLYASTLVLRQL